jgi:hypothetical protein
MAMTWTSNSLLTAITTFTPFSYRSGMDTINRRGARIGKSLHEAELEKAKQEYKERGYKVIDLKGKSPDAIAFKDGKAVCIEVLPAYYSRNKVSYISHWTYSGKATVYGNLGFDELDIRKYVVVPKDKQHIHKTRSTVKVVPLPSSSKPTNYYPPNLPVETNLA